MNKKLILIIDLVIVLLIAIGLVYLNVGVLGFIKSNAKGIYTDVKNKIQIVNDLCGAAALVIGFAGFALFAKASKDDK